MKRTHRAVTAIAIDEKYLHVFDETTDLDEVQSIIHQTIDRVYPAFYDAQVIAYFKEYHNAVSIAARASQGITLVYRASNKIIGTGSLVGDYLTALYVDERYQGNGLGEMIMKVLIRKAWENNLSRVWLESTPGAKSFHLRLGFRLVSDEIQWVDDTHPLEYTVMELFRTC